MKKYEVRYSVTKTYTAEVMAENSDEAENIVNAEDFEGGNSDGWEDEMEIYNVEEVLEESHLDDLMKYFGVDAFEEQFVEMIEEMFEEGDS